MALELPPFVLQGMGLAPPAPPPAVDVPPVPQLPPPVDSALPGLGQPAPMPPPAQQPAAPPSQDRTEIPISPEAFGQHQQAPPPSPQSQTPARPLTPDQQLQRAQQKQGAADVAAVDAIADETNAQRQQAANEVGAYKQYDEQVDALHKQQAAQAAEAAKTHAAKQAYVDSTMKAVDSYKVDQNKYVKDAGIGQMAGWGIAMILSGIGGALQHRQGPDPVVQMLQDKIKQSVQLQFDARDQLKERNQRAQHDLDKYDAWSKDRMAQTQLLEAQYERRLAHMIQEAAVKSKDPLAVANGEKAAAEVLKSSAEKAQKAAEFASTNAIAKQQLGVSQGNLAVSRFSAQESQRHNLATEALTGQQRELEAAKLEREGRNNDAKLVRERSIGGEIKPVKDASGKVTGYETGLITKKNGETWVPNGTEPVVTEFQKGHEAAMRLLSTIDEIRRLGPEWMSNTVNSTKAQELRQQMADARLEAIKYHGLGVPTGHDVELAEGSIGTSDPTRFKDSMGGLDKARGSIIKNMNISMRARGLDKDWEGPLDPLVAAQAPPSPLQTTATMLKAKPDENPSRAADAAFNAAYKANGGNREQALAASTEAAQRARSGAVSPQQQQGIEALKARAAGGDADALAALQDVAKSAASARVKQLAQEALSELKAPPSEPSSSAGPSYDPLGYDPQSLIQRFHQPVQPTIAPGPRSP